MRCWPLWRRYSDDPGTLDVEVAGRGGVPVTGVSAVAVNITVTEPIGGGFLTTWPSGAPRPLASSLNFAPGQTVANLAMVKVGANGRISIYDGGGAVHVIADVAGWFGTEGAGAGARYHPLAPARVLDTRTGNGTIIPLAPVSAHGGSSGRSGNL